MLIEKHLRIIDVPVDLKDELAKALVVVRKVKFGYEDNDVKEGLATQIITVFQVENKTGFDLNFFTLKIGTIFVHALVVPVALHNIIEVEQSLKPNDRILN